MTIKPHPLVSIRRAAVPLVCFQTPDAAATVRDCIASLNGKSKEVPIIEWDIVRGWIGRNDAGGNVLTSCDPPYDPPYDPQAMQFPESLKMLCDNAASCPKLLAFVHNIHRVIDRDGVVQGICGTAGKCSKARMHPMPCRAIFHAPP